MTSVMRYLTSARQLDIEPVVSNEMRISIGGGPSVVEASVSVGVGGFSEAFIDELGFVVDVSMRSEMLSKSLTFPTAGDADSGSSNVQFTDSSAPSTTGSFTSISSLLLTELSMSGDREVSSPDGCAGADSSDMSTLSSTGLLVSAAASSIYTSALSRSNASVDTLVSVVFDSSNDCGGDETLSPSMTSLTDLSLAVEAAPVSGSGSKISVSALLSGVRVCVLSLLPHSVDGAVLAGGDGSCDRPVVNSLKLPPALDEVLINTAAIVCFPVFKILISSPSWFIVILLVSLGSGDLLL